MLVSFPRVHLSLTSKWVFSFCFVHSSRYKATPTNNHDDDDDVRELRTTDILHEPEDSK